MPSLRTIFEVVWILLVVNVFVFALIFAFRRGYSLYLYSLTSDFIHWQDLYERCKPGDVVCFARAHDPVLKTSLDRMGSVVSLRTDVFHAGIIGLYNNQKHFFHIGPYNYPDDFPGVPGGFIYPDTHVMRHSLKEYLEYNATHYDVVVRYYEMNDVKSESLKDSIYDVVESFAAQQYTFTIGTDPVNVFAVLRSFFTGESRRFMYERKRMYCTNFVAIVLEHLDLLPISRNPYLDYSPKNLHHIMFQFPDIWRVSTLRFSNQPIPPLDSVF